MPYMGEVTRHQVSAIDTAYPLSQEQLDFYWDNGYLVIRKLFDLNLVALFKQRFLDICNDYENSKNFVTIIRDPLLYAEDVDPERYVNKIQDLLHDPTYSRYSEAPRLLHAVGQLVGRELTAANLMLINKPPGTLKHSPHQDLFYIPVRPSHKIVGSWTALEPASRDNGCLYVVPRSHRPEVLHPHVRCEHEMKQYFYGIVPEQAVAPEAARVPLEMSPGDSVLFHPYLVHGSGPNVTQRCRKALTCHYASSSCRYVALSDPKQEHFARHIAGELTRRGFDYTYVDFFRLKTKPVRGVRSNL